MGDLSISATRATVSCCGSAKDTSDVETFVLLCLNQETYDRALHSLEQHMHDKKPLWIKYVATEDSETKVLTDVQQFVRREVNDDTGEPCSVPLRTILDGNLNFSYSFEHGEIYWIVVLRTGQYGNRFPVDERMNEVVGHRLLDLLLRQH